MSYGTNTNNTYCTITYYLTGFLFLLCVYLFIRVKVYNYELEMFNLVKLYDLKKNDTITNNIIIRKQGGETCNISSIYKEGKKRTVKTGDCID